MKSDRRYRLLDILFLDIIFTILLFVVMWVALFRHTPYSLEFKEQIGIFLFGADRIEWYLSNPAVIASFAGDWLTQFYVKGMIGATLSTLLLLAIMGGLVRFYRLAEPHRPVCLVLLMLPVVLEGMFIPFLNYPVSATIGLAISVWSACALARIKDSGLCALLYALSVPVIFVIAGGHAFTTALLLAFLKRRDGAVPMIGIAVGLIAMMVCGRLYNLTLLQSFIWPVCPGYIIPGTFLLLLQSVLIVAVMVLSLLFTRIGKPRVRLSLLSLLCIISLLPVRNQGNRDLERIVKIGTLAYRNRWDDVRKMAASYDDRNMYSDYYWNLCNAREGLLADGLLAVPWDRISNSLFLSTGKGDPVFSMMYFTDALLEMGDVSQATDCALLAQTIMPGHYSTRMLRRLAEISVVTGDYPVAAKYLDILSRTRNHKAWANEMLECISEDNIPDQYLVWRSRTAGNDTFHHQGDMRSSLAIIASESPYNNIAIDYLLCSYLIDKKVNTFVSLYDRYYLGSLDHLTEVPELYQEALLMNVNSRESLVETVEKYHLSQKVVDKFIGLMQARSRSDNPNVLTEESAGTYWNYVMAVRFNNGNRE